MKYNNIFLFAICFLFSGMSFCIGHIPELSIKDNYLKAKELYEKERYAHAKKSFSKIIDYYATNVGVQNKETIILCKYYIAKSSYLLKDKNAAFHINSFLSEYPDHNLSDQLKFLKGKLFFEKKKFKQAIFQFSQVKEDLLTNNEIIELNFKKGYSYFYKKDFTNAVTSFEIIKDIQSPYFYPTNYYVAYMAYYNKDYEKALNCFYKVNVSKLFKKVVPYYIAQIYFIKKQYKKVVEFASPLLRSPNFKYADETTYLVGKSYFNMEDYDESLPYLKDHVNTASKLIPSDLYNLGFCYYKVHNYEKAIDYLKEISDNKDSLAQNANYIIANCFLLLDQKRNARAAFFKTKNIGLVSELTELSGFNYAKLSYELNLYPDAINNMQTFLSVYPESTFETEAKELLTEMFLRTNDYQKAINVIESIKALSPKVKQAYQKVCYLRATELLKDHDVSGCIGALNKSLKNPIDKNINTSSYFWLGEASFLNNSLKNTQIYFNKYLELYPLSDKFNFNESPPFAYYTLAYSYYKAGKYNDALTYFEKSLKGLKNVNNNDKQSKVFMRTYPDALIRAADCNFLIRNYARSMKYYTETIDQKYPGIDYALFQKSILYGLGKNANANKKIESLKKLLTNYSWSLYADDASFELADTYFNSGNYDNAIEQFNNTITNYKGSKHNRRSLLKLALIFFNKNKLTEAEKYCTDLLDNFPSSEETKEVVHVLKDIYIEKGDPEGYMALNKKYKDINLSLEEQDSIMYYAAENQYIKEACPKAVELFSKYIDHYPNGYFSINAHYYKSQCLINNNEFFKAKEDLDYVYKQGNSKFTEKVLSQLCDIYHYEDQDWNKAFISYKELYHIAEYKSNKIKAIKGLSICSYELEKYNTCIKYGKLVLDSIQHQVSDDNYLLKFYMARSYYDLNKLDSAYQLFDSLSINQDNEFSVEALYWKAIIHFKNAEYDTCKKLCYHFISDVPTNEYWRVRCFILLADIFSFENNNYQAKATLESIIENYEGNDLKLIAQEKLDSIIKEEEKVALPIISEDSLEKESFITEDSTIFFEYDTVIMQKGDTIFIEKEEYEK